MAFLRRAIQVGLNGPVFPISTPSAASGAFSAAIQDLASTGGGELFVYPGYEDPPSQQHRKYLLDATVVVDVPNVALRFAPGAVLDFANSSIETLFHVRAPGFRCVGATVDHVTTQKDGRSCFLVGDPTTGLNADDASFLDCTFRIQQNVDVLRSFSCLRAEGREAVPRRGLDVSGCTFELLAGTRQVAAWLGDEPYGVCVLRCRNSQGVQFRENLVHGPSEAVKGACGPVLLLDNAPGARVACNVLRGLDLVPATDGQGNTPPASSLVRMTTHGIHIGHRSILSQNVVRAVDARFVVELLAARDDHVLCNVFQGIGPHCDAVVKTGQATGVLSQGRTLSISANVFNQIDGGGQPATKGTPIWLEHIDSVGCSGSVFSEIPHPRQPFVTGPGPCSDLHFSPVQAVDA